MFAVGGNGGVATRALLAVPLDGLATNHGVSLFLKFWGYFSFSIKEKTIHAMTDVAVVRWHTDPQPVYDSEEDNLELRDLIDINSSAPLYALLSNAKPADADDAAWLASIVAQFDMHVTRVLHTLHVKPWDRDYAIRDEYKRVYGVASVPHEWNIRAIMARLLTYREVVDYCQRAESCSHSAAARGGGAIAFLTRASAREARAKPIWSLDCISGGIRNEQQRKYRIMTGINPAAPRVAYHVTFERPWSSSHKVARLDPMHHWGVYMDVDNDNVWSTQDKPLRVLMACCAEPVGKTQGCWMALKDDAQAIEGVVKPYRLFHTVFANAWRDNTFPTAAAIAKDYQIGTAFKDYAKYNGLHTRIQAALPAASQAIADGYNAYASALDAALDKGEEKNGDAIRETNPFERVLNDAQRAAIALPIVLQHEFNDIQCMGALVPPTMRDYVNTHIFRVHDMLEYYTYKRVGGVLIGNERIKMLSNDQVELQRITFLIQQIDKANDARLNDIRAEAVKIETAIIDLNKQEERRVRLQSLNELYTQQASSATIPATLDWKGVQTSLANMKFIEESLVRKQRSINKSLRSMRPGATLEQVNQSRIASVPDLSTIRTVDLDEFEKNIGVVILVKAVTSGTVVAVQPQGLLKPTQLQQLYVSIETEEKKLAQQFAIIPLDDPSIRDDIKINTNAYEVELGKADAQRKAIMATIATLKQQLINVSGSGGDDAVKLGAVEQLKVDDALKQLRLDVREKVIEVEAKAVNAYNVARRAANQRYQDRIVEEQRRKAAALTAAKAAVSKAGLAVSTVTVTTNTADPKTEVVDKVIKPLLAEAALLSALDANDQVLLKYVGSVQERLKKLADLIPTKQEIDSAKPEIRVPLVAALSNTDSILQAANRLALALNKLADDLNDANAKQTIDNILAKALPYAEAARNTVKTVEQMQVRLRREADDKIVQSNRSAYPKLVTWLASSGRAFLLGSAEGLSATNGLRDSRIAFTATERSWPVFKSNGTLPSEFNARQIPQVELSYLKLFLGESPSPVVEQTWKAFGEYVLYRGTSLENDKRQALELLFAAYKNALPKQPRSVINMDNTTNLTSFMLDYNTLQPPSDSMFHKETFIWRANSCWLDSTFLAMFAYPKNRLAERVLRGGLGRYKSVRVTYEDGSAQNIDKDCGPDDLKRLHESIAQDIIQIESPVPAFPVCQLRARDLWTKCVLDALPKDEQGIATHAFGTASAVFETIRYIYDIKDMEIRSEAFSPAVTVPNDLPPGTRFYVHDTGYNPAQQQDNRGQLIVDLDAGAFTLSAIVCGSGEHFVTYLRDFYKDEWMYIDVMAKDWSIKKTLAPDVHHLKTPQFKPLIYYYIRKEDVRALLPKAAPASTPPVAQKPGSLFSGNNGEVMPDSVPAMIALFSKAKIASAAFPQRRRAALLEGDWRDIGDYVQTLDAARKEGLFYAWFHVGDADDRRFVVGITRADVDVDELEAAAAMSPPTSPPPEEESEDEVPAPAVDETPPVTPAPKPTPVRADLVGGRVYARPTSSKAFEEVWNDIQSTGIGNRPELGLTPKFQDIRDVFDDSYRVTGLMHAWWGATQTPPNNEAMVRGMSMADL